MTLFLLFDGAAAIPKTSVLGAVLLTGYLGGATASHLSVGEPFIFPVMMAIMAWGALYLIAAPLRDFVRARADRMGG